jgi:phosphoribosylformimino-5-aminoimidazole carboxamide ribotide isomerase
MKIIPAIDIMEGSVVRIVRGDPANKQVYGNSPVETAKRWEKSGADMLHVVDLDATLRTGHNNLEIISQIIDAVKIPVQIGGGIRSISAINEMFSKNVAKVVIGTMAFTEPQSIKQLSKKKIEKIVISIDQINGMVMIDGWRKPSGSGIGDSINGFMALGIREFLLTSIDRDGTLDGPDISALSFASSFGTKIIASGGISTIEDIIRVRNVGCSSVILGKSLYEGLVSLEKIKAIL